jgi:hypothetical protein
MPAHLRGDPVLAEPMGELEFAQQGGLLKDIELAGAVAAKKLAKGLVGASGPDVVLIEIYVLTRTSLQDRSILPAKARNKLLSLRI